MNTNFRHKLSIHALLLLSLTAIIFVAGNSSPIYADTTDSTTFGSGVFGYCDFGSCTITLSSSGSVSLSATPTTSGACTVQSDSVSVTTDNTLGYTLTFTTSTTNTAMTSGGNSIPASSGTQASPVVLANNTWGYRVDSLGGFGAGPTTAQSNGTQPSLTFAGVPASNGTPNQIASSTTPANPAVITKAWYGLCATTSQPSGTYSVTVTYTAVTN